MHLVGEPAEALALLAAESGHVGGYFRTGFRRSPVCKGFVSGGIVGTLFYLEDDGIGFADHHAVPGAWFDVNEGGVWCQWMTCGDIAVVVENENIKGSGEEAHRFGGVWEGMAVGLHVGSRLQKVEETLDARLLASLNWLHDTEAGALAGSFFSLVQEVGRH